MRVWLTLGGLLVWISTPLFAAEPTTLKSAPFKDAMAANHQLLETGLFLLLILGVIIGLAVVVRRLGYLPIKNRGSVTVLGGVSLGPRERAVVLQAGQTRMLLGVAPGRVEMLCILEGEEEPDEQTDGSPSFAKRLDREIGEGE